MLIINLKIMLDQLYYQPIMVTNQLGPVLFCHMLIVTQKEKRAL